MGNEKPHVQQARNELENALAHGNGERAKAARKALAAAGVTDAAEARRAAAEGDEQEQRSSTLPKGRSRKPQQTTEKAHPEAVEAEPDVQDSPRRKPGERLSLG